MNVHDQVVKRLVWPEDPTIETLADAVADAIGVPVTLQDLPAEEFRGSIGGFTYATRARAVVCYDQTASRLLMEQTVLHEFAHLLHGDVLPGADPIHFRSTFDDPQERRAELTGTCLRYELEHRRRSSRENAAVLNFFSWRAPRR